MTVDAADDPGSITRRLRAHREGDRDAFDRLVARVYDELRKMARQQLRRARPGARLDTVALVRDAYARLVDESGIDWQDRSHFYAVVARALRCVVVDRARRHGAQTPGAGDPRPTAESSAADPGGPARGLTRPPLHRRAGAGSDMPRELRAGPAVSGA